MATASYSIWGCNMLIRMPHRDCSVDSIMEDVVLADAAEDFQALGVQCQRMPCIYPRFDIPAMYERHAKGATVPQHYVPCL